MEQELPQPIPSAVEEKPKNNIWPHLILLLIFVPLGIYFYFGLSHLTQFETADEHLWVSDLYEGRIQKYWEAAANKDWKQTRINDKPGITLALVSGIGTWFEKDVKSKIIVKKNLWSMYDPSKTKETYYIYRLPILIFNGVMSIFFLLAFWRLTKKHWFALAAATFILLSPILIGISQIINPDSLLWVFSFAGLLSFFLFLKENRFIDGFLTALFFGMALLSKYVAIIFIPFFLVLLFGYFLFNYRDLIEKNKFRRSAIITTFAYPLIIAAGIGIFALFMPAAIADTDIIYESIIDFGNMRKIILICIGLDLFILLDAILLKSLIGKLLAKNLQFLKIILPKVMYLCLTVLVVATIVNWSLKPDFLHIPFFEVGGGKTKLLKQLPFYQQIVLQLKTLLFSLTPVTLFLILFLWIKSIFRKSVFDFLIFMLSLFFIVFFIAVTKQELLVHIRYSVIVYPFALTLAGFGFYELTKSLKYYYSMILFVIIACVSIWNILTIKPYYFNYTNELLPKKSIIATAWGYGGYEAAEFISAQGDPAQTTVWSDYVGFCSFYKGKCLNENALKWANQEMLSGIKYYVTSFQGQKKNMPSLKALNDYNPNYELVWELNIGNRPDNFVKIYKNKLYK